MNNLVLRIFASGVMPAILFLNQAVAPMTVQPHHTISINAGGLDSLLDPIFAQQMARLHIPGAVIAIVKDGKVLFTKGYGYADIEKKTPAVPNKTIFRIGSITKVFTATAVMQLADRGKISLKDDVNRYLKAFQVPATYHQPITFANLLTHTSGLDEITPGRRTSDRSKVIPLAEFLKTRMVRILPPGQIISYSTYNAAPGGLLVEQITGTPFKVYLRQNIFEPLGLNHTSIADVTPEYKQDLATGYEYDGKNHQKLPFQWFNTYPASDINSTASDMARFMIANLAGGALDGKRILSQRAMAEMQATHFRNHPRVPGWAYGYYEGYQNGRRYVEHGGSMDDGYSALLTMFPKEKFGLFVACNTETGGFGLGEALKQALINHYFPVSEKPAASNKVTNQTPASLQRFAGKYRGYIYCHTCPPNSGAYFPDPVEVKVNDDGTLSFQEGRWRQVEALLFELASGPRAGQRLLAFREGPDSTIAFMFQEAFRTYERVSQ
ncbi:MAG: serine hydrolase domain-containing protein [Pyrinomonadaceae bacterium]